MTEEIKIPKKRGRKPKGGKIVEQKKDDVDVKDGNPSVILHLKCRKSDIIENDYDPTIYNIEPYTKDTIQYEIIKHNEVETKEYNNDSVNDKKNNI